MSSAQDLVDTPVPAVNIYKNVFNLDDVNRFINHIEEECADRNGGLYWDDSFIGNGNLSDYRSSLACNLDLFMDPRQDSPVKQLFMESIARKIVECAEDYCEQYTVGHGMHEPFNLLKYSAGAHYRSHYDYGPNMHRIFSIVAYLKNTSTGGDLELPFFNTIIKAEENSVLVFPSSYPYTHYAHPVIDGVKYSLVTWYR